MEYPIGIAKTEFSRLLREAHEAPVIITRRGRPDVVMLAYDDYERLRRLQAYQQTLRLSAKLQDSGVTASELYETSRRELEADS
jgi:prevent-host-death family protein